MANIFAVYGVDDPEQAGKQIAASFQQQISVPDNCWLVASSTLRTAAEVYDAIKAVGGDIRCIVSPLGSYYGWHDKRVWDWIEANGA